MDEDVRGAVEVGLRKDLLVGHPGDDVAGAAGNHVASCLDVFELVELRVGQWPVGKCRVAETVGGPHGGIGKQSADDRYDHGSGELMTAESKVPVATAAANG